MNKHKTTVDKGILVEIIVKGNTANLKMLKPPVQVNFFYLLINITDNAKL